MKRITGIFIVVLSLLLGNNKADAQTWQIGGDMTSFYVSAFRYQFSALGGYEFNDKIAVQASFGITGVENYSNYLAGAYFRYTPWHSDVLYLDLRFRALIRTDLTVTEGADIGITPILRFRCNQHWDFFATIGSLGARYEEFNWAPCIGLINSNTDIGVIYRF